MNRPTLPGAGTVINPPFTLIDSRPLGPRIADAEGAYNDVWVRFSGHIEIPLSVTPY